MWIVNWSLVKWLVVKHAAGEGGEAWKALLAPLLARARGTGRPL